MIHTIHIFISTIIDTINLTEEEFTQNKFTTKLFFFK